MSNLTIREIAKEIRKFGLNRVVLYNGTEIYLYENLMSKEQKSQAIGTLKFDKDDNIIALRRIFCGINPSSKTKGIKDLKANKTWWLYDPKSDFNCFKENDFCLPERELNSFITQNGGIDHYETVTCISYVLG